MGVREGKDTGTCDPRQPGRSRPHSISASAADSVIGGFSAGAVAAATVAFHHPDVFGNLLSQSAGLGRNAAGRPNAIARMYEDGARQPVRIYQDVGLYEPNTERNREWKAVLTAKGYDLIYRERGATHEPLHFAGTLPEALMALLPPRR
jgi:enterochelin esterase-like enzyme